jgi:uncharacterized protein DUF6766/uncharacterized protein DUF2188
MSGAVIMVVVMAVMAGITIYLVGMLVRTMQLEKRTKMKLWKNFGLSLGFCSLFLISWAGQAAVQWQEFTDEARTHNQQPQIPDYLAAFGKSTLENWQSEFLQLFSFTVMTALLIHKGSAESRDSDDRIEAALKRIEDKLGTEPTLEGVEALRQGRDLHVVPDGFEGWAVKDESSPEPEGYYDHQEDAIEGARDLARRRGVKYYVHGRDGTLRSPDG